MTPDGRPGAGRRVRDRDVVLIFGAVVGVVLALNLVSALVPPLERFLQVAPVVVIGMIAVTLLVLYRTFRRGSRGG
jgi:uncharacterized protein YhhL (DUF1145 family)